MTSIRKLERDFVKADLAAVNSLLDQLTEEDVMSRLGLESRRRELLASINEFGTEVDDTFASAALFFGGRPVVGTRGIESEFGAGAVATFQNLIAKMMAQETTGLGQRGIVPNKDAATLHITNVVRGSFGFLLEEMQPQRQIVGTALKIAVDKASQLLDAFGEADEEGFQSAVENADQRVLQTARDFFELMRINGATLRIVAGDTDRSFGTQAVQRAAERAMSTTLDEVTEIVRGHLAGVLPDARQFEFRTTSGTIRGRVDKTVPPEVVATFNRDFLEIDAFARLSVKRVRHNGEVVREAYTLLGFDPPTPLTPPSALMPKA